MRQVYQRTGTDCGIAAVAMVSGVPYAVAKAIMFPRGPHPETYFATEKYDLRRALRYLGIRVARNLVRCPSDPSGLRLSAILNSINEDEEAHWAVWDQERKKLLDPWRPGHRRLRVLSALYVGGR